MSDYLEELGRRRPSHEILPEDQEGLAMTVEITKHVLSAPKTVRLDHVYHAIESWENLQAYLSDAETADLVGEIVELLVHVFRNHDLTFQEAQHGKRTVKVVAQFLGIPLRRSPQVWD